jgi:hypothetical protein
VKGNLVKSLEEGVPCACETRRLFQFEAIYDCCLGGVQEFEEPK